MVTATKRRACDGKTRHASREKALAAMRSLAERGGHSLKRLNVFAVPDTQARRTSALARRAPADGQEAMT